jgi:hypothetical protein
VFGSILRVAAQVKLSIGFKYVVAVFVEAVHEVVLASATFEIVQIPTVHVKKDKESDIKNS